MPRFLIPRGASREIFKVAVTVVGETTVRLVTGISRPTPVTAKAPVRLVPVKVTVTAAPRAPDIGRIDVSVGAGGAVTVTVKATGLLTPPGVDTLTLRALVAAVLEMARFALTVVLLTTTRVHPDPQHTTPQMTRLPVILTMSRLKVLSIMSIHHQNV